MMKGYFQRIKIFTLFETKVKNKKFAV